MTEKENEWIIRFDDFFSYHKYDFWRFCAKKRTKKFVVAFTTDTDDISWLITGFQFMTEKKMNEWIISLRRKFFDKLVQL